MGLVLLILLIILLVGVIPNWPHSKDYGHGPSRLVGILLIILIVLILTGNISLRI